jgi:FkbM family methyltransferase
MFYSVARTEHERVIFNYYARQVTPGMIVFDVGANIGIHTVQLARRVGTQGKVVAFEPEPENLELLHESLAINGVKDWVIVVGQAVDSKTGEATFYRDHVTLATGSLVPKPGGNTQGHEYGGKPPELTKMPTVTIDDFLAEHPQLVPSLVKIDVEGAEARVLRGMNRTLQTHHPRMILDSFEPEAADLLFETGYTLHDLIADRAVVRGEPLPFTALASAG